LDYTGVPAKWHLDPSNGLSWGTNVTDDRQTDHAMEICVKIGGIACAAQRKSDAA